MIQNRRVLVLNKSWLAIGTTTLENAIIKLTSPYKDGFPKAKIVDCLNDFKSFDWSDWTKMQPSDDEEGIRTVNSVLRIPEVIQFTRYDKVPQKEIHYNRRTIFLRDENQCQYCMSKEDLSLDHVLPRCQGGLTNWENVVVACVKCNLKKAGRTPQQAGMKLLKKPVKPKCNFFVGDQRVRSWSQFIGEAYWLTELEHDK
jgi:5-methylcytosine-specific restriction endonuclease McrA